MPQVLLTMVPVILLIRSYTVWARPQETPNLSKPEILIITPLSVNNLEHKAVVLDFSVQFTTESRFS